MKCLRCGHCCSALAVIIVKPEFVDDDLDFNDPSIADKFTAKWDSEDCPYLIRHVNGTTTCTIHNKPWYHKTPCFKHGQIEQSPEDVCRMGHYILNKTGHNTRKE